ncbi:MAG: sigma-70 RNA polymerase sigma factor region 4 domain-containing protein [Planctomycetota bacterium]
MNTHRAEEKTGRAPLSGRDVFPTTQITLIGRLLGGGPAGRVEAGRHIMTVYDRPLRVYLTGSSFRTLGDPSEIVEGFFAHRLGREGFLEDWLQSGRRLRYWLIRAFKNYLQEQIRLAKRRRRAPDRARYDTAPDEADANDPETLFHREAALAIIREAYRLTERDCRSVALDDHWRAFVSHHLDGRDYRTLGAELDVAPGRAKVMARTAANRFRARLREMITWSGAQDQEIDLEIQALVEALQR